MKALFSILILVTSIATINAQTLLNSRIETASAVSAVVLNLEGEVETRSTASTQVMIETTVTCDCGSNLVTVLNQSGAFTLMTSNSVETMNIASKELKPVSVYRNGNRVDCDIVRTYVVYLPAHLKLVASTLR